MALLFFDGFDERYAYNTMWTVQQTVSTSTGRYGGLSRRMGNYSYEHTLRFTPANTVIIGFALSVWSISLSQPLIRLGDPSQDGDGNYHLGVGFDNTGAPQLWRGTTSVPINPTPLTSQRLLGDGTWYFIEIKATLDDTVGTCVLRVNGQEWINYTGDTRYSGTATQWGVLRFGDMANSEQLVDDFYLCDATGTSHNDFLGDVKVESLVPTAPGSTNQWTGSDGDSIDNHLMHADASGSSSTYVESATPGARELYHYQPLSTNVSAVNSLIDVQKSAIGFGSVRTVVRAPSGATITSNPISLTDSPKVATTGPMTTDPDGNPWTGDSVAATDFGVELV